MECSIFIIHGDNDNKFYLYPLALCTEHVMFRTRAQLQFHFLKQLINFIIQLGTYTYRNKKPL